MSAFKSRKRLWYLALAFLLVCIDQGIKGMILYWFHQEYQSVWLIPHLLRITYVTNSGAAFSILSGFPVFLTVLSALMTIICALLLFCNKIQSPSKLIFLSFILAGGIGNLLDRILRGVVVDYIDLQIWPLQHFAIFNFADCCVCIGAVGLFISIILDGFLEKKEQKDGKADT